MPDATGATLRERIAQDLPDALAPAATAPPESPSPNRKSEAPVDLLATTDPLVLPERLPEVACFLRDTLGYEFLSNITITDYLAAGLFEAVYHFANLRGGPAVALKVRIPRDQPRLPSLTPWWPGANLQEREAFDLFGIVFDGHPNLRRVYMWDEFEGFPMRRDFPKQGDKYFSDREE